MREREGRNKGLEDRAETRGWRWGQGAGTRGWKTGAVGEERVGARRWRTGRKANLKRHVRGRCTRGAGRQGGVRERGWNAMYERGWRRKTGRKANLKRHVRERPAVGSRRKGGVFQNGVLEPTHTAHTPRLQQPPLTPPPHGSSAPQTPHSTLGQAATALTHTPARPQASPAEVERSMFRV